jgi:hypothetical protein
MFAGVCGAAFADAVTLNCQASGAAGSVSFVAMFDEASQQVSASWSAGGGRPAAAAFGESGVDRPIQSSVTMTSIYGVFRSVAGAVADPYAYTVSIDRTNGSLQFQRSGSVPFTTSTGSCQKATTQRVF